MSMEKRAPRGSKAVLTVRARPDQSICGRCGQPFDQVGKQDGLCGACQNINSTGKMTIQHARILCVLSQEELAILAKIDYVLLGKIEADERLHPELREQIWSGIRQAAARKIRRLEQRIEELRSI